MAGQMRVIKQRRISNQVPNDLRGLGEDDLISNTQPIAFLSIKGVQRATLDATAKKFNLSFEDSKHKNICHMTYVGKNHNTNYKHQTLYLFGAALEIGHKRPELKMHLGLMDKFGQTLTQAIEDQRQKKQPSFDDLALLYLKRNIRFSFTPLAALILRQTAIPVVVTHHPSLTHDEMEHLYQGFLHEATVPNETAPNQKNGTEQKTA